MAKYILLDFDGVVTSKTYTMKCYRERARENIYGMDWFDPECVEALKKIVDDTGAKIVVSSSWRDLRIEQLQRIWEYIPMPGELVGTTPIWILTKKDAIEHWIKQHPDDRYVILDDADLGLDNQIRTDPHTGLVRDDAERAISLLNQEYPYTHPARFGPFVASPGMAHNDSVELADANNLPSAGNLFLAGSRAELPVQPIL